MWFHLLEFKLDKGRFLSILFTTISLVMLTDGHWINIEWANGREEGKEEKEEGREAEGDWLCMLLGGQAHHVSSLGKIKLMHRASRWWMFSQRRPKETEWASFPSLGFPSFDAPNPRESVMRFPVHSYRPRKKLCPSRITSYLLPPDTLPRAHRVSGRTEHLVRVNNTGGQCTGRIIRRGLCEHSHPAADSVSQRSLRGSLSEPSHLPSSPPIHTSTGWMRSPKFSCCRPVITTVLRGFKSWGPFCHKWDHVILTGGGRLWRVSLLLRQDWVSSSRSHFHSLGPSLLLRSTNFTKCWCNTCALQ